MAATVLTPHRNRGVRDGRVKTVAAMKGAGKGDPAYRIAFLDGVLVGAGNPLEDLPEPIWRTPPKSLVETRKASTERSLGKSVAVKRDFPWSRRRHRERSAAVPGG